jgi:hypothetical protein
MEKYDVIPEPEDAPDRGNYPKIGNSDYCFNLWYKFPKLIEKKRADNGLYHSIENWRGNNNFISDDLIDYIRESMSGIKLIEDFDEHEDRWSRDPKERVKYTYRIGAFIPERECGMDSVYAQVNMRSFDEIDYQKSGEWVAKMLEKLGAEIDIEKCIQRIKSQQAEAKELLDSSDELIAMIAEANEKLRKAIYSDKPREE